MVTGPFTLVLSQVQPLFYNTLGGIALVLEMLVVLGARVDAVDPLIDDVADAAVLLEVNVLLVVVDDALEANLLLALAVERTVDLLLAVPDDTVVVDVLFRCADDVIEADVAVAFDPAVLKTELNGETGFVSVGVGPKGAGVGSMFVPFT